MSELQVAEAPEASAWAGLLEWLCWAGPLVFLIGAPSVLITRFIFLRHHPEHFVGTSPTISETASWQPSSLFFECTIALVTVCIIVFWSLNMLRNRRRVGGLALGGAHRLWASALYTMAGLVGIGAGLSLLSLAVFKLHDPNDIHMISSWIFYICQALSITMDIIFVLWMRRFATTQAGDGLRSRAIIALVIFITSWFFLYMYESKNNAAPENRYAVQLVYVYSEYFLAMIFFYYPVTVYGDLRRHFREFAAADRRG